MAARIYGLDWASTPLGPRSSWPECLTSAVEIMLPSQAQIVMFWGQDFIALYNDAYAPTIGDKHPHALGRPARENWSELWSDLEPLLRRVFENGETVVAKDRPFYIERHGYAETAYFDISYSPVRDEQRVIQGVFCIVSETTERVRSIEAVRNSEERFRAIFSQTASGIAQTDLDGRLLLVNNRFCEIVGHDRADLLGTGLQDITHAGDLEEYARSFDTMIETGRSFEIEMRCMRRDGSLVWVAGSVSAFRDHTGSISGAAAVIVDITERKRAEEVEQQLGAIIASSNDAILSTNLDMVIASWNSGAEKLYGYSAAEAIGQSVMMFVPADRSAEEQAIFSRIRSGQEVEPYETKRRRKDGILVDVLLSVSPIYDPYGNIVGASKIAHDITARKEAERLQTVLVGELHHRVKNLLATVMAIARQTFGRDEANKTASDIFEARLAAMVRAHDVLMRGNWEQADLGVVVAQALSPYPQEKFDILGPAIQLSPRAVVSLSLALHELATNAAKYGALSVPEGRVTVAWSLEQGTPARLRLHWQETGGPTVATPTRKGFGSRMIASVLAAELNGEVKIIYDSQGVICEVNALAGPTWDQGAA